MAERILLSLLLTFVVAGCATPHGRWGHEARYAPAVRGYVLTADNGSDDPTEGAPTLVLTDPVTGDKLQCQEQVARWIAPHQDHAEALVHDENLELAGVLAMAPLVGAGVYLALPGLALVGTGSLGRDIAGSRDVADVHAEGEAHVRRRRYDEGRLLLERALVRDPGLAQHTTALLYLGIAYAELDREDEATRALEAFVRRAAIRDVKAYRTAERWLKVLGHDVHVDCRSQSPYPLRWSET